jgi:putative SOS response-associated peptidase YedK
MPEAGASAKRDDGVSANHVDLLAARVARCGRGCIILLSRVYTSCVHSLTEGVRGEAMCHRITPLLMAELREALEELRASGHARVPVPEPDVAVPDAYPGSSVPLIVVDSWGQLEPTELSWGFRQPMGGSSKLVFNTRIETALSQARSGRGLWSQPILHGRCLVPVRGFYESWTKAPPRRGAQVRFTYPGHRVFLLAGVWQENRFSVVTTEPNPSVVSVHSRMPLVLGPGESSIWLGPDFASLADRSRIALASEFDGGEPLR